MTQQEEVTIRYGSSSVYGLVESDSADHPHSVIVHLDGRRMCDCKGFYYRDHCSHIDRLLDAVPARSTRQSLEDALEIDYKDNTNMALQEEDLCIPTSLMTFNEMMSPTGQMKGSLAGIPQKTGIGLCGKPQAGKTTLSFQLGHEVMRSKGEGSNMLLFDTEGSMHTYYSWMKTFQTRFGLDTEIVPVELDYRNGEVQNMTTDKDPDKDHHIFLLDVRNLPKIHALHGRPSKVNTEDSKMKLEPNGEFPDDIRKTPMGQFVFQENIDYTVYDSITNPLEEFTNRQQDRPTRAKATAWWMLQAQSLAEERDMVQVFITHLSKNPTNPYDRPDILGGKNVKHQIKYSMYLREAQDNERAMRLFRHPGKEPWTDEWFVDLQGGKGFVDINE